MFGSDVSENITLDMQVSYWLHTPARRCTARQKELVKSAETGSCRETQIARHASLTDCCGCRTHVRDQMQVASPRAPPTIISMWLVIINPISKLALTLAPVAMAVEVRQLAGVDRAAV
jgi:hypothetical protein